MCKSPYTAIRIVWPRRLRPIAPDPYTGGPYCPHLLRIMETPLFGKISLTRPLPSIIYSPSTWYVCLVSAQNGHTVCTSCLTHQKYCSFINYALNHYQVPSCNSYWAWPFSLFRRFIVLFTCLNLFLFYQVVRPLGARVSINTCTCTCKNSDVISPSSGRAGRPYLQRKKIAPLVTPHKTVVISCRQAS